MTSEAVISSNQDSSYRKAEQLHCNVKLRSAASSTEVDARLGSEEHLDGRKANELQRTKMRGRGWPG